MPDIPVPDVADWPTAVAFVAVLGYLAFKAWLDSGRTKDTNAKVSTLEATLTTTNGGSHIKDQLNRIEKTVGEVQQDVSSVSERVTVLEGFPRAVDVTVHPVEIEKGTD